VRHFRLASGSARRRKCHSRAQNAGSFVPGVRAGIWDRKKAAEGRNPRRGSGMFAAIGPQMDRSNTRKGPQERRQSKRRLDRAPRHKSAYQAPLFDTHL
jgi:hypothetical protein